MQKQPSSTTEPAQLAYAWRASASSLAKAARRRPSSACGGSACIESIFSHWALDARLRVCVAVNFANWHEAFAHGRHLLSSPVVPTEPLNSPIRHAVHEGGSMTSATLHMREAMPTQFPDA